MSAVVLRRLQALQLTNFFEGDLAVVYFFGGVLVAAFECQLGLIQMFLCSMFQLENLQVVVVQGSPTILERAALGYRRLYRGSFSDFLQELRLFWRVKELTQRHGGTIALSGNGKGLKRIRCPFRSSTRDRARNRHSSQVE